MKNLKILALLGIFAFSMVSFATKENPKVNKQLRDQIVKMLGKTTNVILTDKVEAEVVFTLNDKSEIVILSVNSENKKFDSFVKSRLNYKKVTVKVLNQGDIFRLPLIIKKKYE